MLRSSRVENLPERGKVACSELPSVRWRRFCNSQARVKLGTVQASHVVEASAKSRSPLSCSDPDSFEPFREHRTTSALPLAPKLKPFSAAFMSWDSGLQIIGLKIRPFGSPAA